MKTINAWKISTVALAGALAFVVSNGAVRDASADPQPRMRAALDMLEKAHAELKAATADKGGHRVKAMELTAAAIAETKAGIEYDNKH
jgi:hypothetical protein